LKTLYLYSYWTSNLCSNLHYLIFHIHWIISWKAYPLSEPEDRFLFFSFLSTCCFCFLYVVWNVFERRYYSSKTKKTCKWGM